MTISHPNILEIVESGDFDQFLKALDAAVKTATRDASVRSHALGLEVADGRAQEDRVRKTIK